MNRWINTDLQFNITDFISIARAITVDFGIQFNSRKPWTYHIEDKPISKANGDVSTQESVKLEDLFEMREQLQQHKHLRLREQLKMQQELLHKQQVWMHQQLQKKSFLRLPRKEATTLDDWQFTRIINKQTETTEVKSRFKTV